MVTASWTSQECRALKAFAWDATATWHHLWLAGRICGGSSWNDFDRAKAAIASEASALRGVVLLADSFPEEQRSRLRSLINGHIDEAVHQEWPAMAEQRVTL